MPAVRRCVRERQPSEEAFAHGAQAGAARAAAHAATRATAHAAVYATATAWRRRTLESGATWQRQLRNTDNC